MTTSPSFTPMGQFLHQDFLLTTEASRRLFHEVATELPIIDYHTHLSPQQIAEDHQFAHLTEAWLEGDHYKWRAMRANGIDEYYITGAASEEEKFLKWAETVPHTLRNPLFHWTHLELRRYFGIGEWLNPDNAQMIYARANEQLRSSDRSYTRLLKKMKVELVCTTDDPTDDLMSHQIIQEKYDDLKVWPTFRPDRLFKIDQGEHFRQFIALLGQRTGREIDSYDLLLEAIGERVSYFASLGGRLSDHGLDQFEFVTPDPKTAATLFSRALQGDTIGSSEKTIFQSTLLVELGQLYHEVGWAQQFHIGALRNVNTRLYQQLGPDIGCDTIGDHAVGPSLARFLATLDHQGKLARTILYNLNPRDNALFATMAANFNDGTTPGKVQYGAAWWFLDQKRGIEAQLEDLSNFGLLPHFIGMLTDSRSVLSYPRHEYFRRILCDMIGRDMENGLLPADMDWMADLVRNVCYFNVKRYLGL